MKKLFKLAITLLFLQIGTNQFYAQNLISNPGFEIFGSWVKDGDFYYNYATSNPHGGNYYAYLTGTPGGTPGNGLSGYVKQTITIPSGASSAVLGFYASISTQESATGVAYDFLKVKVNGSTKYTLDNTDGTTGTNISGSNCTICSYSFHTVSLTQYIGQTIEIKFEGSTDSSLPTVFRIDDVLVLAAAPTVCPDPTNLQVSNVGNTSATLSWNGPLLSGWDGFDIRVYDSNGNTVKSENDWQSNSYPVTGLQAGETYTWRVRTDCNGLGRSNYIYGSAFTTTGCSSPSITNQPNNDTECVNGNAYFSISASNASSYQWQFQSGGTGGFANLSGQTSSSLSISTVNFGDAGNYRCKVSNSCGTVYSSTASLTVNSCSPNVNFSANATQIEAGGTINFSGQASNNPTYWNWNFGGGAPGTASTQNPSGIQFDTPKCYTISLTAGNSSGSDTETKACYIKVLPDYTDPPSKDFAQKLDHPFAEGGDPVNLATGAFLYIYRDYEIQARNSVLNWNRYYNSQDNTYLRDLGYGWSHTYDIHLTVDPGNRWTVHHPDGHESYHIPYENGSSLPLYAGTYESMKENANGSFTLTKKDSTLWQFDSSGKLNTIIDRNANSLVLAYNSNGKLSTVTAPGGRQLAFTYHPNGLINNVSDPLGRVASFTYDVNLNLNTATNTDGNTASFTYDPIHQMETLTDPNGNLMLTNVYDANQRVSEQTDALNGQFTFLYDTPVSNATTLVNPLNDTSVYHHDVYYRLTQETDELGHSRYFTYDQDHNPIQITDENGKITYQIFDGNGNLLSHTSPLNQQTQIGYNPTSDPTSIVNALGQQISFVYDNQGNLQTTTLPGNVTVQATYDPFGQRLTFTDGENLSTAYTYSSQGDLTLINAPVNDINMSYDLAGRITSVTDGKGNPTQFEYDGFDNITRIIDAYGDSTVYTYDANGNRVSAQDKKGQVTYYIYDAKDRLIKITDPKGGETSMGYDAMDHLIAITDANSHSITFGYDERGQMTTRTDANGTTTYAYDLVGNLISVTNPLAEQTRFFYDDYNRLDSVVNDLNQDQVYGYDELNRLAFYKDALNQMTSYAYDSLGNLSQVHDAASVSTYYTYNNNSQLVSIANPKGFVKQLTYNNVGLLASEIDPEGNSHTYSYDLAGNLIGESIPNGAGAFINGIPVTFGYDSLNRRTSAVYGTGENYGYSFDKNGNLISMSTNGLTTTISYDSLDRMLSLTDGFGKQVGYNYDPVGNIEQLLYPDGKTVSYTYDSNNQLTAVLDWLGNVTSYNYDAAGRLTQTILGNGTKATYGYDPTGRLDQKGNEFPGGATIQSSQFTLDPIGRRTAEQRTEPLSVIFQAAAISYSYDDADMLVQNTASSFSNDKNGNRVIDLGSNGNSAFSFSGNNLLTQRAFTYQTTNITTNYEYDPLYNRIMKSINGEETRYVLDLSGELSQVLQETDSNGNTIASYVYGLGLISRTDSIGTTHFYHFDAQGNTVALTNSAGTMTDSYAYDPFGQEMAHNGTTDQPYRFLGQYGVQAEGEQLYYIRRRYYDATNGRFISSDPYPANSGNPQSLNRFAYALNDPIDLMDVNGMYAEGNKQSTGTRKWSPEAIERLKIITANNQITMDKAMAEFDEAYDKALRRLDLFGYFPYGGIGVSLGYLINNPSKETIKDLFVEIGWEAVGGKVGKYLSKKALGSRSVRRFTNNFIDNIRFKPSYKSIVSRTSRYLVREFGKRKKASKYLIELVSEDIVTEAAVSVSRNLISKIFAR